MVKNLPTNAGDIRNLGSIPGSERSPEGGNSNPPQYSCLENSFDGGAWLQIDMTKCTHTHTHTHTLGLNGSLHVKLLEQCRIHRKCLPHAKYQHYYLSRSCILKMASLSPLCSVRTPDAHVFELIPSLLSLRSAPDLTVDAPCPGPTLSLSTPLIRQGTNCIICLQHLGLCPGPGRLV